MIETTLSNPVIDVIDIPLMGDGASRRVNAAALRAWIRPHYPCSHVFVEVAGSMPGQGVASVFRYGRAVGAIEAVIACCEIPMTLVAPASWKHHFGLRGTDKEQSRQMAIQRFPGAVSLLLRKKDHGRSEGLLIAAYGAHLLTKGKMECVVPVVDTHGTATELPSI